MRDYKADFPIFGRDKTVYIDNAATAQRPACVLDAVRDFYLVHNANPLRGLYALSVAATEDVEAAREAVRAFIGARHAAEIIFTRGTTEGLNLVAYSYGLSQIHAGDEVLVSVTEHHSDLLPWQMVCRATGAVLRYIECEPDGRIDLDKVEKLITDKTKLVAVAQVSNVLGRVNPIREIADMAHRVGAVLVCDGAQSTPHMQVDVQALGADFFAFSGHKLYGPMGIGVLYGRRELLEKMPPFLTGGEMIESVTRDGALHAAIDYVNRIGFDTVHARELAVSRLAFDKLRAMPHVHVLGAERAEEHNGILTFTLDDVHPHDVGEILAADGIAVRAGHHCAQPLLTHLGYRSTVRASFAFYNTADDAEKFIDSLSTVRERMGYGK